MSVAAGIWRHPLLTIARAHRRVARVIEVPTPPPSTEGPLASLARQIFFSHSPAPLTRLLLTTAGPETNIADFAERLGKALAQASGGTVGVVENRSAGPIQINGSNSSKKQRDFWRSQKAQIAERLWRVNADILAAAARQGMEISSEMLPFDHVLFAASVNDSMFQPLCNCSEGAVLVLTANKTHKQSALRAQRMLQQCSVKLLGTVLEKPRISDSGIYLSATLGT